MHRAAYLVWLMERNSEQEHALVVELDETDLGHMAAVELRATFSVLADSTEAVRESRLDGGGRDVLRCGATLDKCCTT